MENKLCNCGQACNCWENYLGESFWQKVGGAFTDPDKRFEFPIKPIETDFTPQAKTALYLTAGILAAGAIVTALIITRK